MNLDHYPEVNVLNVIRGFVSSGLPYKITPYRFTLSNGRKCIIEEIRQFHSEPSGKGNQFHYTVKCKDGLFYRLVFDTSSLIWRLLEGEEHSHRF
jgi:hypothetical protein